MNEYIARHKPAKLLWTGGWDSTFQILRLVFLERRSVEPYYLIDEARRSTETELFVMQRIRDMIQEKDKSAAAFIKPTRFFSASEVPHHPEIHRAFLYIKNRINIGIQNEWFANFCEDQGIREMQLGIHQDDNAAAVVTWMLANPRFVNNTVADCGDKWDYASVHQVFKYFDFPILALTKINMAAIAEENGWTDIMNTTWFCHTPSKGQPCGRCNPCRYAIGEGMGWRIPVHRRIVGNIYIATIKPAKMVFKKLVHRWQK